jgi:chromosome segregation ATPase
MANKAMDTKETGTNMKKIDEFLESVDDTQDVMNMIENDIGEYSREIIDRQAEWKEYAKDHGFENDEWMEMANETLETVRLYLNDLDKAMKYLYDLAYKPFDEIF